MTRFLDFLRRFATICSLGLTVMATHPPVVVADGRTAAMASMTAREGYTIQLAAFSRRSEADVLAASLPGAWVQEVRPDGHPIFRVNYGRFDDRSEAVRAQWSLEDQGYKSFIQQLFS